MAQLVEHLSKNITKKQKYEVQSLTLWGKAKDAAFSTSTVSCEFSNSGGCGYYLAKYWATQMVTSLTEIGNIEGGIE
jgi:hypothetical protein